MLIVIGLNNVFNAVNVEIKYISYIQHMWLLCRPIVCMNFMLEV